MKEEIWKPTKDFPDYAVSNFGRVKRIRNSSKNKARAGLIMKPSLKKNGYLQACLTKGKGRSYIGVHRLVLESFDRYPLPGEQGNHKNGNKMDNCIENLEWSSPSENRVHAFRTGLSKREKILGEKHGHTFLKNGEVYLIKKLAASGMISQRTIGKMFRINQPHVSCIHSGKTWGHIVYP